MIKKLIIVVLFISFLTGCKTSNGANERRHIDYPLETNIQEDSEYIESLRSSANIDSVLSNTTDFYKIKITSKSIKKTFNIDEPKLMTITITNYGQKTLFLPEYFKQHNLDNNREMFIEIYKKSGKTYKKYIQKKLKTHTYFQPTFNQNRIIYETKKGKTISYENNQIDFLKKIVDPGSYMVKIEIDLSNFGYFKLLKTDILFEVVE